MEIKLPQGCNVFYGTYIDNYRNNIRTRYYINDGELITNSQQNYSYDPRPNGYVCIDKLTYHSEFNVFFEVLSLIIVLLAFFLIYKTIIKRLLP